MMYAIKNSKLLKAQIASRGEKNYLKNHCQLKDSTTNNNLKNN